MTQVNEALRQGDTFNWESRRAFRYAGEEMSKWGSAQVDVPQLLFGIFRHEREVAQGVIRRSGMDAKQVGKAQEWLGAHYSRGIAWQHGVKCWKFAYSDHVHSGLSWAAHYVRDKMCGPIAPIHILCGIAATTDWLTELYRARVIDYALCDMVQRLATTNLPYTNSSNAIPRADVDRIIGDLSYMKATIDDRVPHPGCFSDEAIHCLLIAESLQQQSGGTELSVSNLLVGIIRSQMSERRGIWTRIAVDLGSLHSRFMVKEYIPQMTLAIPVGRFWVSHNVQSVLSLSIGIAQGLGMAQLTSDCLLLGIVESGFAQGDEFLKATGCTKKRLSSIFMDLLDRCHDDLEVALFYCQELLFAPSELALFIDKAVGERSMSIWQRMKCIFGFARDYGRARMRMPSIPHVASEHSR